MLCAVFVVQCEMYSVPCALGSLHCVISSLLFAVCDCGACCMYSGVFNVLCVVCGGPFAVRGVVCVLGIVCGVQCFVLSVLRQCEVYIAWGQFAACGV